MLTSPSGTPEQARELARELDIELPPRDFLAVDHLNYHPVLGAEKHDVLMVSRPARSAATQNYFSGEGDVAFRGAGHTLGNRPLLFPVLRASRSAYTYDTKEDFSFAQDPWAAGNQMGLVSALQTRGNARVVVAGSADMFSDEFFAIEGAVNREFSRDLTQWVFQEVGVVQTVAVRHYLTNQTERVVNPNVYRVKNEIVGYSSGGDDGDGGGGLTG